MRNIITTLGLFISILPFLNAQDLKTYSGPMQESIWGEGKATYTYYDKNGESIKHGKFNYEWTDNETETVRDKNFTYKLSKKISGSYKNGRKDGSWTFVINFTDYKLDYASSFQGVPRSNIHSTGSITKTVNYKDGKPHGSWKYRQNFKSRYINPVSTYTWNWSNYDSPSSISVDAEFQDGIITGSLIYNDTYNNESARLSFDNDGYLEGQQVVKSSGTESIMEIENRIYVKDTKRHSDGKTEVIKDLTNKELSSDKYSFDTIQYPYIENNALKWFKQFKYFNQSCCIASTNKRPLIDGGDFYENGLKGGLVLNPIEAVPLTRDQVARRLKFVNTEYGSPTYIDEHFIDYETKELRITLTDEDTMIKTGIATYIEDEHVINEIKKRLRDKKKQYQYEINEKAGRIVDEWPKEYEEKLISYEESLIDELDEIFGKTIEEIYDDIFRLKAKINAQEKDTRNARPLIQSDVEPFNKNANKILNILKNASDKRKAWTENQKQIKEEIFNEANYRKYLALDDLYLNLIFDRLNDNYDNKVEMLPIVWFSSNDLFEYINEIEEEKIEKSYGTSGTTSTKISVIEQKSERLNYTLAPQGRIERDFNDISVYWGQIEKKSNGDVFKKSINELTTSNDILNRDSLLNYVAQAELFFERTLIGDVYYLPYFAQAFIELKELEQNKGQFSIDEISNQVLLISDTLKSRIQSAKSKSVILNYEDLIFRLNNKMLSDDTKSQAKEKLSSFGLGLDGVWVKLINSLTGYKESILLNNYDMTEQSNLTSVNDKILILSELLRTPSDKINEIAQNLKKEIRKDNYDLIWKGISESL